MSTGPRLSTGTTDSNLYRFVGSQGVMAEPLIPGLYFMRARYYLADASVFLSVDPVKNIGSSWKPEVYTYAGSNPRINSDADGRFFKVTAGALAGIIQTTAVMNYEMIQFLVSDGKIGKSYSQAEVISKIAGGAVEGVIGKKLPGFFGEGLGTSAGLAVERGIGSILNVEYADSFSDSLQGELIDHTISSLISGIIPDVSGSKGKEKWGTKAVKHGIADIGRGIVGSMVSNFATKSAPQITAISALHAQIANQSTTVNPQKPTTSSSQSNFAGSRVTGNQSPTSGITSKPGTITIQYGDTLSKIARSNNTDVATLMRLNPQISDPNRINSGAKLNVPVK